MQCNTLRWLFVRGLIRLVRLALWPCSLRFRRALAAPENAQRRVLQTLVRQLAKTEYGRQYGVADNDGYAAFRDKLPIVSYEDLRPWIERQRRNEGNVLVAERVQCYGRTSGSSGFVKHIPYTGSVLGAFRSTFCLWLFDLISHGPRFLTGRIFLGVSPSGGHQIVTEQGVRLGADSDLEFVPGWLRWLMAQFLALDPRVVRIRDAEAFKCVVALSLLAADDVETISIWSPSYLIVLLEYIRSHRDALIAEWSAGRTVQEGMVFRVRRPSPDRLALLTRDPVPWGRLWPSMNLISCWDDSQPSSSASYLRRTFPDAVLQGKGLFSTEAPMTVPIIPAHGCVPIVTELFFEFADEAGRISRLHELEKGKTYSVIFSQVNGFARYRIGDRVKVSGYYEHTPCLDFVGREGVVCDLVGEKLHEQCVKEAIAQLHLADSRFQMLIPVPFSEGPSYYLLLLDKLEADAEDVSRRLDELLQGSYRYREARLMGQLNVPKVHVAADAQERCLEYFARQGMRWGNIKHTYLVRNPQDGRALAEGIRGS